jgi:hypothetical protein
MSSTVQRVELKDCKRAAMALAEAFMEDPVTLYFCQHPSSVSKEQAQARNEYSIVSFRAATNSGL